MNFNNDDFKNFDRDFNRAQKMVYVGWVISAVLSIGTLGFVIWVAVALLRFFGVV